VIHARATGQGQVIDCAMVDGAASLMAMFYGWKGVGFWRDQRDANLLDGGAHFYGVYECADGGWITLGAVEAPFYAEMLRRLGLEEPAFGGQFDRARWPALKARIAEVVRTRTRDEWRAVFEGSDACFAPVLSMEEAPSHPHNLARGTFIERDGVVQPAPAPRFSATPGAVQGPPPAVGAHTAEVLAEWGLSAGEIAALAPNPA
jgi:alpha-methylacyl-CoA racemase